MSLAPSIEVSVIVTSYNHEKFIARALDTVFMQTGVNFEVLLADDCSTDNTLLIMQEFLKKHPENTRILERKNNLGMSLNMFDAYHCARGKYIAICEGDDFWVSPNKLKKQVDFLESYQFFFRCL